MRKRTFLLTLIRAQYFFDRIPAIAAADYVPTTDDILRVRIRTTGIVEAAFDVHDLHLSLLDVGGQVRLSAPHA